MNAKKAVPLILCILLFLSGCSVAISPKANSVAGNNTPPSANRENENILEANMILAVIKEKNSLLALELGKLPDLKSTISMKEVESLKNILALDKNTLFFANNQ